MEYNEMNLIIFQINNNHIEDGGKGSWRRTNLSNSGTQYFEYILQV